MDNMEIATKEMEVTRQTHNMVTLERTTDISTEMLRQNSLYRVELKKWTSSTPAFATIASEIAQASVSSANAKNVYKCVFPSGVSGSLLPFKHENAFTGTIRGANGKFCQARWVPVKDVSVLSQVNVGSIILSVAVAELNAKLAGITRLQKKTIDFLETERRNTLMGQIDTTCKEFQNFPYCFNNPEWRTATIGTAQACIGHALGTIRSYRDALTELKKHQKQFHTNKDANELMQEIMKNLDGYNLSVQLYALSICLEALLYKNTDLNDFEKVQLSIDTQQRQFELEFDNCRSLLMGYYNSSIGNTVEIVRSSAIKVTADMLYRQSDNITPRSMLWYLSDRSAKKRLSRFDDKRNSFIESFTSSRETHVNEIIEETKKLSAMIDKQSAIYFDSEYVYIVEEPKSIDARDQRYHEGTALLENPI